MIGAQRAHAEPDVALTPTAAGDAIYAYTDDRGRLVHVQRLEDVPPQLRAWAKRVDIAEDRRAQRATGVLERLWPSSNDASAAAANAEPIMYRYRAANGRTVYTNLQASVPGPQRAIARIDLRDVPLNSELGAALNEQLTERYETLQKSPACSQLKAAAHERSSWWSWQHLSESDQRPFVYCGAALLVIVLGTPYMLRRGWGAQWARVLQTATPILGFVAVSTYMLLRTSRSMSELQTRAARCEKDALQGAHDLPQRFQLVQALEEEQRALAQIDREAKQ